RPRQRREEDRCIDERTCCPSVRETARGVSIAAGVRADAITSSPSSRGRRAVEQRPKWLDATTEGPFTPLLGRCASFCGGCGSNRQPREHIVEHALAVTAMGTAPRDESVRP